MSKSTIDLSKETNELNCFETAVELGLKKSGDTAKILRFLNGESINRNKNDKPDIIKKCLEKNGDEIIVGIEHFYVDQMAVKKKGKLSSISKESDTIINQIYENGHKQLVETNDVDENTMLSLGEKALERVIETQNYSMNSLSYALDYYIEQHNRSLDEYINNLKTLFPGQRVEIAYLINMAVCFNPLFLTKNGIVSVKRNGIPPITEDITDVLDKIDSSKVKYVIILFSNSIYKEKAEVYAIKTGNIKKRFVNQGITVYAYFDEYKYHKGVYKSKFAGINNHASEKSFLYKVLYQRDVGVLRNDLLKCLSEIWKCKKNNKPYVISFSMAAMEYELRNVVAKIKKEGDKYLIEYKNNTPPSKEYLNKKQKEFDTKYNIEKPKN